MFKIKTIAEIGCNHQGNIETAFEMVKAAKSCGVDYVKLQKRCPKICVPDHMKNAKHPNPVHSFGETYLEHREALEFSLEQHIKLYSFCCENNIKYSCSVWDIPSAKDILQLKPEYIKIPSAANINYDLLSFLFSESDVDIHISLGMITKQEKEKLFEFIYDYKYRIVVYWTTSEYPVPFERVYLNEIANLKKEFPRVGFSGHHRGIAIDIAAATLGAEYIERHFTLDRTMKGSDHAASLEPIGLQKLVRDISALEKAMSNKDVEMTDIEKQTRFKLKTF